VEIDGAGKTLARLGSDVPGAFKVLRVRRCGFLRPTKVRRTGERHSLFCQSAPGSRIRNAQPAAGAAITARSRREAAVYDDLGFDRHHPRPRLEQEGMGFGCRGCSETDKGLHSVLCNLRSGAVRYSSQVKPISYLKANAAEVLTHLAENRTPLVITQNGEAKAVLQDVASFEETQETLALLKILALGQQDVEAGRLEPVTAVVARLRAKRAAA
jgi:prevent-host-death family protein